MIKVGMECYKSDKNLTIRYTDCGDKIKDYFPC